MDKSFLTRCKTFIHVILLFALPVYYFPLRRNDTSTILVASAQMLIFTYTLITQITAFFDYIVGGAGIYSIVHDLKQCEQKLQCYKVEYASNLTKLIHLFLMLYIPPTYLFQICFTCHSIYHNENPLIMAKWYLMGLWSIKMYYAALINLLIRDNFLRINDLLKEIRDDVGNNCRVCNGIECDDKISNLCLKHALQ